MAIQWKTNRKVKPDSSNAVALPLSLESPASDVVVGVSPETPLERSPEEQGLTDGQVIVRRQAMQWFLDNRSYMRLLSGYAGTGKTFMLINLVQSLVDAGVLKWNQVVGVAPTHTAVGILKGSTGGKFGSYKTLASLLSLRPSVVEWDLIQQSALEELLVIDEDDRTPDQAEHLDSLLTLKHAADNMLISFQPTKSMSKIAGELEGVRLIVVDEASMIDAVSFAHLNELLESMFMAQAVLVGDPAQLPPVGEKEARAITIRERFPELTEVKRYDGPILDYATALRNGEPLQNLHYQIASQVGEHEQFIICPYADGVRIAAECIQEGDEVRFLTATNAAADTINYQVRSLVKGSSELFYEPGDVLITKSPIARDQDGSCRPYPGKGRSIDIYVGTSSLIQITKIVGSSTFKTLFGTVFEKLEVCAIDLSTGEPIPTLVHVLNPNQWNAWIEEQKLAFQVYKSACASARSKSKRGQEGKMAQKAWEVLGIKNWYQHNSGFDITDSEYQQYRRRLQSHSFALKQFADECTFSYASTVHRAQGAGYEIVCLHMPSLLKESKGRSDEAWDIRKLLYTAATRARKQLIFLV